MKPTRTRVGASPKKIEQAVRSGRIEPAYFFHGTEEFSMRELIATIREEILKSADPSTGWRVYDLAETPVGEVLADIKTVSFFSERRGVLVLNMQTKGKIQDIISTDDVEQKGRKLAGGSRLDQTEQEALLEYLKNPSPDVVLVIACGQTDGRLKFWKELSSSSCEINFEFSGDAERRVDISERLRSSGIQFTDEAREWIIETFVDRPSRLDSELKKLETYLGGTPTAKLEDLEACVSAPAAEKVFSLAESIALKKVTESLEILDSLRVQGEVHFMLLGLVARQFRILILLKWCGERGLSIDEAARMCGFPPYVYHKYAEQAGKFSLEQLKRCICALSQADLRIKASGMNAWHVLEQEVISLIQVPPPAGGKVRASPLPSR